MKLVLVKEVQKLKKKILKTCLFALPVICTAMCLSGCEKTLSAFKGEDIKISIGYWVKENEKLAEYKSEFEKENANTEIIPLTYVFSLNNFEEMAVNNKLPNLYRAYYTEIKSLIEKGYATDITDILDEAGWSQYMNPELKTLLSDENGRIYGIPYEVYSQGLYINKEIFRQSGLVDEHGDILYPKTLTEMAEYAQIVHEKTGKAGFVMPTVQNNGGWHFLNIAWNFGTNFIERQEDGKYKAIFDTQETRDALQYVKDLKWKYNVLPNVKDIGNEKYKELFTTGEVAMMFSPPLSFQAEKYGMSKDDVMVVGMPAGPGGCFSQMGGTAYIVSGRTSEEQIKKILKWIEFIGRGPNCGEKQYQIFEQECKVRRDNGGIVIARDTFNIWLNETTNDRKQEIRSKYCNIDPRDYENYYKFSGVQIRPEIEVHCQDLYSILDKCVQAVIEDKNADVAELVSNANSEFQTKFLD